MKPRPRLARQHVRAIRRCCILKAGSTLSVFALPNPPRTRSSSLGEVLPLNACSLYTIACALSSNKVNAVLPSVSVQTWLTPLRSSNNTSTRDFIRQGRLFLSILVLGMSLKVPLMSRMASRAIVRWYSELRIPRTYTYTPHSFFLPRPPFRSLIDAARRRTINFASQHSRLVGYDAENSKASKCLTMHVSTPGRCHVSCLSAPFFTRRYVRSIYSTF